MCFRRVKIQVVQLNSPGLENGHQFKFELFFLGFFLLCLISFMCVSCVHGVSPNVSLCNFPQTSDSGVLVHSMSSFVFQIQDLLHHKHVTKMGGHVAPNNPSFKTHARYYRLENEAPREKAWIWGSCPSCFFFARTSAILFLSRNLLCQNHGVSQHLAAS